MSKKIEKIDVGGALRIAPPVPAKVVFSVPARYRAGTLEALKAIRKLFGPNGRNWIQGKEHDSYLVGQWSYEHHRRVERIFDGYCLLGAAKKVDGRYENFARSAIALAILESYDGQFLTVAKVKDEGTITWYNDSNHWPAIQKVLKRARQIVANGLR